MLLAASCASRCADTLWCPRTRDCVDPRSRPPPRFPRRLRRTSRRCRSTLCRDRFPNATPRPPLYTRFCSHPCARCPGPAPERVCHPVVRLSSFAILSPKFYSQANGKARPLGLHKRMKNGETGDNSLDEKKDGVELMIALVSCNRSRRQTDEIKQATNEVLRP